MSAGVRKNFIFDPTVAQHLKELAALEGKSLNKTVQELVEERYKEIEKQAKIATAMEIAGSATELFGDLSIQEIKGMMHV
jgi:hypothetical protein